MSDESIVDIGVGVGDYGGGGDVRASDRDLQRLRGSERSTNRRDRRSGLGRALVAILAAIGVIVAVPLLTGGDDNEEQGSENSRAPASASGDNGSGTGRGAAAPTSAPATGTIFEPPAVSHLRSDDVASVFGGAIDTDAVQYGVAYVANGDFTILDHRGISVPEPLIAQRYATVMTLGLLTSGGRTWAIDATDRDRSYLVSNTYVVVVSQRPGTIAVINPDNLADIGLMSAGLPVPSLELPEGADLLWVQGRGLLILPRTGGTFEVGGIASSLTRISDERAVAASLGATVYERCDDTLACAYVLQAVGDVVVELPFPQGARFSLSPDGQWLVAMAADESSTLFAVSTAQERVLTVGEVSAVDWAPDSSFVVIVRNDMVEIVYPATGQTIEILLNDVPDNDSLLVFSS
ncbi:MAG: hypothetical protein ACI88C_000531 [Acidimicrobiales bacterium]|jgi:hypothetical protein